MLHVNPYYPYYSTKSISALNNPDHQPPTVAGILPLMVAGGKAGFVLQIILCIRDSNFYTAAVRIRLDI